ncbi:unnamed protein product [Pieris macdunnoughi]|uniref:Beta-glucosidase n=1 Tax=Pieris macdunnoughi TaxID=345717 RepID=A0A821SLQ5_9NEOP|nr:unnamed protein product [Pieris macdunnoughi]
MLIIFLFLCTLSSCTPGILPTDLIFGVATSSYQIEGAWNEDGKGENVWDRLTHTKRDKIADKSTADTACDSYHLWETDIKMLKWLGVKIYRFSISWPRILPTGYTNVTNRAGIEYYNRLIDGLLEAGIEPMVTLFHWDLPVDLQLRGGWNVPESISLFVDYADFVMSQYADRVRYWLTMNEVRIYCDHNTNILIPDGLIDPERAPYDCTRNLLLAHAKVYHIFNKKYRSLNNGLMSVANLFAWYETAMGDEDEKKSTELLLQYYNGRFNHPIFSNEGGWPSLLIEYMEEYSKSKGYNTSLLPPFSEEEKQLIKGTADYIGVNHYFTFISKKVSIEKSDMFFNTNEISWREGWPETPIPAIGENKTKEYKKYNYSPGIRHVINWIRENYEEWDILITENGYRGGNIRDLIDLKRVSYIRDLLRQVILSMKEDGHKIIGYIYWSLMDNFEWWSGYKEKFGLFDVDFKDPNRTRTARLSAKYFACITRRRDLDACLRNV